MNFENIFADLESPWPPDSKTGLTFSNGAILSPTVPKTKSVKESKISEGKYYFPSLILEALCTKESEIVEEKNFSRLGDAGAVTIHSLSHFLRARPPIVAPRSLLPVFN